MKFKTIISYNIILFIIKIRIRKPDLYRMQVGCSDFDVEKYYEFKEKFLKRNNNLRLIKREKYEMIEFFNPDYDVLGYIVSDT